MLLVLYGLRPLQNSSRKTILLRSIAKNNEHLHGISAQTAALLLESKSAANCYEMAALGTSHFSELLLFQTKNIDIRFLM